MLIKNHPFDKYIIFGEKKTANAPYQFVNDIFIIYLYGVIIRNGQELKLFFNLN